MIKQKKWSARTGDAASARRLRARIEKMLCAGVLLCTASASWGNCHVEVGYVAKQMQIDIGDVIIREDQPIGAVLATREAPIPVLGKSEVMGNCKGWGNAHGKVDSQFPPNAVSPNVFDSNIPGIGLRLARTMMDKNGNGTVHYYPHDVPNLGLLTLYSGSSFKVEVVKTGPITGVGPLTMGRFTNYYTDGDGDGKPLITTTLSGRGITIKPASCTLDPGSKMIQVAMPNTSLSQFKGPGTAGTSKAFDIVLQCSDIGQDRQDIYIQIDTTNPVAGLAGVIGLTDEPDAAQGIGIQLSDKTGLPIVFAVPTKMGQHTGEGGQKKIGLQAAYFQIADQTKAGLANGTVTFTMSYK